jgi:hypothetical protein
VSAVELAFDVGELRPHEPGDGRVDAVDETLVLARELVGRSDALIGEVFARVERE